MEEMLDHFKEHTCVEFKRLKTEEEKNQYDYKIMIVHDEKNLHLIKSWEAEKLQREKLFLGLNDAGENDIILFSDSDEIPNPKLLKNFILEKKYGIFMQKFFVYKLNIYNGHESPWEGTRVCKKKDLKSFTHLRKKILKKNLAKPFWKFHLEKNIKILDDGGWHFNNLYTINKISQKIKASPHQEFNNPKFYDEKIIKKNILELRDLYGRNHQYKKIAIDESYPDFLLKNLDKLQDYIL